MIIKIHDVSETGICLRHQVTGEGYLLSWAQSKELVSISGQTEVVRSKRIKKTGTK
jgi:hypothetical protein